MSESTPEQIGREAGQAIADSIADGLETVILKLTDAIASLRVEQAELRDELVAEADRLDKLFRVVMLMNEKIVYKQPQTEAEAEAFKQQVRDAGFSV